MGFPLLFGTPAVVQMLLIEDFESHLLKPEKDDFIVDPGTVLT